MGNNPDNPIWSTDVGTDEQLYGDIANIDQVRFYIRNPESIDGVRTIVLDKLEGVDKFDTDIIVSVDDRELGSSQINYVLKQNFPNPFNPSTKIQYSIKEDGNVSLKIYNILGQEVFSLLNEYKKAGFYEINFNASKLVSGVYIYQIQSGSFISAKKMILIK
ncbi:MAG: T9SS C-terminal target domain-containing protein [Ignavibacteriales bacterium]|nr:MAG: T9SS C-terminal target domain-containing protein [Ignavibacteriales bacterium]